MNSRRDEKVYPGHRPPPNRTYGSKYRSGRVGRLNHDELRTIPNSPLGGTHQPENEVHRANLTLPTGRIGRGNRRINSVITHGIRSQSAEGISQLVHSAEEGGQGGRAAAVALAEACKSIDTRKGMGVDGGKYVLDKLSSVTRNMLQGGGGQQQRDEAILHCLAVALYTLSKDRALVQRFDGSILCTLAFLIEGCGRRDAEEPSNHTIATEAGSMQSLSVSPDGQEQKKLADNDSVGPLDEHQERKVPEFHLLTSLEGPLRGNDLRNIGVGNVLSGEDNEEEVGARGSEAFAGVGASSARSGLSGGEGDEILESEQTIPYSQGANHGPAGVMVRARMLLDITDMLPWGLANRHLVSAADLGLATMLNVVGRDSPESEAARAPNGGGAGDSLDDEFSTQGSVASRCDSVVLSADGLSDNGKAATRSDVLLELSRLGRSGFFVSLVVDGARDLEYLAASRKGASRGIAVDPSSLRQLHRLLLALRLLDLATLENSPSKDTTSLDSHADAAKPYQDSELAGALLCVVSRCQAVNAGSAGAQQNEESAVAGEVAGQGGLRTRLRSPMSRQEQPFVDEVGSRVHECLLAALRVLVNLTHDDAKVCAAVGAQGGLETLMMCLVAHSDCEVQESDDDISPIARCGRLDSGATLGRTTVGDRRSPGAGASMDDVDDGAGRSRRTGGGFDAQILSMGALINCVELQESADNCAVMGTLAVSPPAEPQAEPGYGRGRELGRGPGRGPPRTRTFLAPEFLGRLLVFCTRSFARHLEVNRATDEDGEETSASPSVPPNDRDDGNNEWNSTQFQNQKRGKDDSAAQLAEPLARPSAPAVNVRSNSGGKMEQHQHQHQQRQEEDEEEEMSHAEGADLVLGGHCALLLGLLIRDQDDIRRSALSVLPERTATLIVRVLEAFMALQYQAGVLTEEVALKVQSLVEDLEEMDGLPIPDEESDDPFELDSEDEVPSIRIPATASKTEAPSRRKGRKRPRCPGSTPTPLGTFPTPLGKSSGQWATDTGGDDCADGFSLSATCPRSIVRKGRALPSWLPHAKSNATASSISSSAFVSDDRTSPWEKKLPPPPPATEEEGRSDAPKTRDNAKTDAGDARPLNRPSPGYAKRAFGARGAGWRIGTASGGKLGLDRGGGTALGTRTWLGGSPPRVYGRNPRKYGRQALTKSSGESLSGIRSSVDPGADRATGSGRMRECHNNGADETDVFGMMSDDTSDDDLPRAGFKVAEGGVGIGEGGSCAGSGVGPTIGRIVAAPAVTKSIFDLDGFSSDESSPKLPASSLAGKYPRVTKSAAVGDVAEDGTRAAGGSNEESASRLPQASGDARALPYDGLNERARRGMSPPRAKEGGPIVAARGVGPRSRRASRGRGASRAPPGAPSSSRDTSNVGVVKRSAVSQYLRRRSESSAHAYDSNQGGNRPPTCTLAPVRDAPESGDGKDVIPAGKRQRAESFAAVAGPRGRMANDEKGKANGVESNNVFEAFDSDAGDAGVCHSSVFDIGDDSE